MQEMKGTQIHSGSGRFPDGNGNPLQFPCLGNLRDRGTWQTIVHRVTKSQMWLSTHTRISAQYITFTLLPKVQFHTHLPFPIFFLLVWNSLLVNICSYSPWVITICGFSLKLLSIFSLFNTQSQLKKWLQERVGEEQNKETWKEPSVHCPIL